MVTETETILVAIAGAQLTIDESTGLTDSDVASLSALPDDYEARLATFGTIKERATADLFTLSGAVNDISFVADADGTPFPAAGIPSGLKTIEGYDITLFVDDQIDNIIVGKYDSDNNGSLDKVAFAVILQETRNTAGQVIDTQFWTVEYTTLQHNLDGLNPDDQIDLTDKLFIKASREIVFSNFDDAPANQNAWTAVDNDPNSTTDPQLLITGLGLIAQSKANDPYGDSVNTRATSLGSNQQSIIKNDGLRFDFVTGITVPIDNTAADFTGSIAYTGGHFEVSGAGVTIVQANPPKTTLSLKVSIYDVVADTAQGNDFVAGLETTDTAGDDNNVEVDIGSIQILGQKANGTTTDLTATATYTITDNVVTITSLPVDMGSTGTKFSGYQILVRSDGGVLFDRLVVENLGDSSFDLGGIRLLDGQVDIEEVGSKVNFDDDGPTAPTLANGATVAHDETAGVDSDTDVAGTTVISQTNSNTVASLFAAISATAIGYARSSTALVTESGGSAGNDGAGTPAKTYSLDLPTGDVYSGVETTGGTRIFLFEEGGLIVGRVGTEGGANPDTANAQGAIAFAIAVDPATGEGFIAQYLSVRHLNTASNDEAVTLSDPAILMNVTLKDRDNDTATATLAIGDRFSLQDDGPTSFSPAAIAAADAVQNQPGEGATKDLTSSNLTTIRGNHSGTDAFGSLLWSGFTNGALLQGTILDASPTLQNLTGKGAGDTSSGPIYLFGAGTTTLVATTNSTDPAVLADRVFTIQLNDAAASDSYTFSMLGQIDNGAESLSINFAGQKQTIYQWLTLDTPGNDPGDVDGPDQNTTIDPAERDGDFLFTGMKRTTVDGAITTGPGVDAEINVSSTGIAVESQSINPLEGVFIDFIDGAPRTLNGQAPISALDFDNHYKVNNAGFSISQLKPGSTTEHDIRVSVYDETAADPADSASQIINNTSLAIASVTVREDVDENPATQQEEHTFTGSGTFTFNLDTASTADDITVEAIFQTLSIGGQTYHFVELENVKDDYTILIETGDGSVAQGFEQILVENVGTGNEGFDISGLVIEQSTAGFPVNMDFGLTLKDGDLDAVTSSIDVTLTTPDQLI